MKRLLGLVLLLAAPAFAQTDMVGSPCKMTDGSCGTPTFTTIPAPSGCATTSVPVFLGSPVALGCDAGLTYDAETDTLTSGRVLAGNGAAATPGYGWSAAAGYGWRWDNSWGPVYVHAGNDTYFVGTGAVFSLPSTGAFSFSSGALGAVGDSGLRRASPGLVGVTDGSAGDGALSAKGVKFVTGSRPTCDAAARGMVWYVAGGAGAADTCEICRKDASDNYAWVTIF